MATYDYTKLKATAERLIAKFGKSGTLHNRGTETGPAYNPTQGVDSNTTITAVDLDQSLVKKPGTLVEGVGRTLLVSTAAGIAPTTDDEITIDGTRHAVVDVRELNPGGTALLYEVDLAK